MFGNRTFRDKFSLHPPERRNFFGDEKVIGLNRDIQKNDSKRNPGISVVITTTDTIAIIKL